MPEQTEGQGLNQKNKQFIETEAPEHLGMDQNLYDQEPFLSLVRSVSESRNERPDKIRKAISVIAEQHSRDPEPENAELLRKTAVFYRTETVIPWDDQAKILELFRMYPYLSEYIKLHLDNQQYHRNGNPASLPQRPKGYRPPPSYANWVTQKLQAPKRAVLFGIDEVFPQDVGHPVTSQPNLTGKKPANRRYRIMEAAGIIPEKR